MDSLQLTNFFTKRDSAQFIGVFSSDKLPTKIKYPVALIVNTAPSTNPGDHWIAIYITRNRDGYYFDSFGRPPTVSSIISFLKKNCKTIDFNTKQIQHLKSIKCGQFSALYLKYRISGGSSQNFLSLFNINLMLNEKIVNSYFSYFGQ
jgi:hypothetical protein